jgi:GTPase SAR1 family protein
VKNRRISKDQQQAARQNDIVVKLLLLGTGDSGKTTLRKQLKNVYGDGFGETSRKQLAPVVIQNIIDGYKDVLKAMGNFDIKLDAGNERSKQAAEIIRSVTGQPSHLTPEQAKACANLLDDDGFASCLARKSEYGLQDCWATFVQELRNYPTWGGEQWIPSTNDCVIARVRTSGIIEESFTLNGVQFRIFDVGGQRAERRKWIHQFDNVTTVIFVMSLSEYDQNLYEDNTKNRLEEALELFDEIANSKWFLNTSILLFMNKRDLFEKKYVEERIPLNVSGCFSDAPDMGENPNPKVAIDYLTELFKKRIRQPEKEFSNFVTTACNPENVQRVFDEAKMKILRRNLVSSGFVMI